MAIIDTNRFAAFATQRDGLAADLVALSTNRKIESTLAERVIAAVGRLDPEQFNQIQRSTQEQFPEQSRHNSYLDFRHYIYKGVRIYLMFMLKSKRTRSVLDIGSGSGSFAFVCNALGHRASGLDLPRDSPGSRRLSVNYLLTHWYGVHVIEHRITPNTPFPVADQSFDDFVMWHPNFYSQWQESDWDYLFADLTRCATRKGSRALIRIQAGERWVFLRAFPSLCRQTGSRAQAEKRRR